MNDPLLAELQARFRETTRARLRDMHSSLARLDENSSHADALSSLTRNFHALAGLGGTYGFPRISELGDEAEASLFQLALPVAPAIRTRWRAILDDVEKELAERRVMTAPQDVPSCDVLVVTHENDIVSSLHRALEQERASVRACDSAEGVFAELDFGTPDVVILDLQLQDGTASSLIQAVRQSQQGESVGILVIGDAADLDAKVRALRAGANAFLPKPLDLAHLVRRVMSFRDRQRRPPSRVLVVEDDPTQIAILRKVLGGAGYDVFFCTDPREFENALTSCAPDLLLMDIHLGRGDDLNGFDLVRLLRQHDQLAHVPVIFVSGDRERDARLGGAMSGGDTFVTKPIDWALLLSHIQSSLERTSALRDRADVDTVTGVLTRTAFFARAPLRISPRTVAVILDLDHFKQINDTFGHGTGDRVLASVGMCLRRGVRHEYDLVGRYGGEEFVLLLEAISRDDAKKLVERLLADCARIDHGNDLRVTFSAGVAAFEESLEATLQQADAAMYEAKRAGRARVVLA